MDEAGGVYSVFEAGQHSGTQAASSTWEVNPLYDNNIHIDSKMGIEPSSSSLSRSASGTSSGVASCTSGVSSHVA